MLLAYFSPYLHSASTASHTSRLSPFRFRKHSATPSFQTTGSPSHLPSQIKNLRFGWLPVPPPRLLKCAKPLCILHRSFPQLTSCSPLPPSLNSQAARAFHFATISLSLHSSWCLKIIPTLIITTINPLLPNSFHFVIADRLIALLLVVTRLKAALP